MKVWLMGVRREKCHVWFWSWNCKTSLLCTVSDWLLGVCGWICCVHIICIWGMELHVMRVVWSKEGEKKLEMWQILRGRRSAQRGRLTRPLCTYKRVDALAGKTRAIWQYCVTNICDELCWVYSVQGFRRVKFHFHSAKGLGTRFVKSCCHFVSTRQQSGCGGFVFAETVLDFR